MLILASVAASIVFEPPPQANIEQLDVVQRIAPDHVRVTLAFTIRVDDEQPRELPLTLDMPRGAAVVGLTLDRERDAMATAELHSYRDARMTYETIVRGRSDPALIELGTPTATHDRYRLHVFPMSATAPARITIDVVVDDPIALISRLQPAFVYERTTLPRPNVTARVGPSTSLLAIEPAVARTMRRRR